MWYIRFIGEPLMTNRTIFAQYKENNANRQLLKSTLADLRVHAVPTRSN